MHHGNSPPGLRDHPEPSAPLVSLTLNRYAAAATWQGLRRMGADHDHLSTVPGLGFYRLLGTGRGTELTLGADLRRWARLAVWTSRDALDRFEGSPWRHHELSVTAESGTLVLRPVRWHGRWGGHEPFGPPGSVTADGAAPVAVLTRAALRLTRLGAFWRAVPATQRALTTSPGLLAVVGLGEVPLLHQATFSVWRDLPSMQAFAYGAGEHRAAIDRTRREGWFRESLFARFTVLDTWGTWDGHAPLKGAAPGGR